MADKKESSKDKYGKGALFIPAGIFLGMGFGFLVDNFTAGLFIGFGLGFLAFAISYLMGK
ncbi:MAG: hypothetical protein ABH835_03100 [Patescibacteria group bacterium]